MKMGARPRVVVLGAGSVGCFVGGAWLAAGCPISFIGREKIQSEIATHGLDLSDQQGWRIHIAAGLVDFSTRPTALKDADIIALCVKSPATAGAAKQIARHARKGATVISFQNGVSNPAALKAILPRHHVVQGMVPYNVVRLGPGRWHRATWGEIHAERQAATEELARQIGNRPGRLVLAGDMVPIAWGKLLLNLNNAINALSGMTILEELGHRDLRRVMAACLVEALGLLDAAKIKPAKIGQIPPALLPHAIAAPDFIFKNLFLRIQKIDPQARSSMSDDLAAGRETEVDYLNGEVVRLAQSLGREAPVNAAIVELIKQAEAGIERIWTPLELRQYVLEGHRGVKAFGY